MQTVKIKMKKGKKKKNMILVRTLGLEEILKNRGKVLLVDFYAFIETFCVLDGI